MSMRALTIIMALVCVSAVSIKLSHAADVISLGLGRVTLVHTSQSIGTVAVGDPAIADVALEGNRAVMVFGKKAGETELVLMSHSHKPILKSRIIVNTAGGADTIVVRRPGSSGMDEEAWFCATSCGKVGPR